MTNIRRRPLVAALALIAALVVAVPLLGTSRAGAADSQVYIVHGIPDVAGRRLRRRPAGPARLPAPHHRRRRSPSPPVTSRSRCSPPAPTRPQAAADRADAAVITQTLAVPSGANVSVVANVEGGTPNLQAFANDLSPVVEGSSRVTVRHTANAPTVDIAVNGTVAIPALAPGAEASEVLPAGTYDFAVQVDGTTVLDLPDTAIPAGKNVIVYAVGNADARRSR